MTEPAIEKRRQTARRSVTRDNAFPLDRGGGYFQILVPSVQPQTGLLPAYLPLDFRVRERVLDSTIRADAMWSAAIGIAITKAAALAWETKSDSELRSKRAQELLLAADATSISGIGGWVSYMGKQVRNFTCTNGGCFTEIIRATGAYGSRIVGLGHLSSLRMRRTGDPEYPFIYLDRWGRQHVMRWWQVFNLVDMPDPDEAALGMGLCAAERAYQQIRKLAALEQYLYEKISGSRPLALHIVNGLTKDQLTDMMASASENQASKGLSLYMGAIVATTLKPDAAPALVTIPLAELPDGFEAATERDRADLIYANALGLDPQDLKPMSNQQMGAGAQSEVLNQKAEGRGQAAYRQQLVHMLNQLVFDDKTQFLFTEHDYRDQQAAANVSAARGTFVAGLVAGQIISAAQGQQVLVEQGELPKAFIEQGAQAGSDLSDTDKPDVNDPLNDASGPPQPLNQPVMQTQAPTPEPDAAAPTPPTTVPPLVPKTTSTTAKPIERKAVGRHQTTSRSVQAGARRILRQIERKGMIHTKASAGVWRTIGGHPVLISGGGGGGSGGGGGGATATAKPKKPAKAYVPKPGSGGSSKYPTIDAYKKGQISHENALAMMKQDIKAAKLAGDTKAVNGLTTQYYAIKNGPHAGTPSTTSSTASGTGKPSPKAAPTISEHQATLAAHNVTEAFANDKIHTASEMHAALDKIGTQSGHTSEQLLSMAKEHEAQIYAGTKAGLTPQHAAESAALKNQLKTGEIDHHDFDEETAFLNKKHMALNTPTGSAVAATTSSAPTTVAGKYGIQENHLQTAVSLLQAKESGAITQAKYQYNMKVAAQLAGTTPENIKAAAKEAHAAGAQGLKVPSAPTTALNAHVAALQGHPLHTQALSLDEQIKSGVASHQDVATFHAQLKAEVDMQQLKVKAAEDATKSALAAGMQPLPSVVKLNNDALDKIDALHALDKHITASADLHGIKAPTVPKMPGVSDEQMLTAMNIDKLYDKGTIKLDAYQKLMDQHAAKLGVSKGELEQVIWNHKVGTTTGGLQKTPNPITTASSAVQAKIATMPPAKQDLIKLGAVYDTHGGTSAEYKTALAMYNVKHGTSLSFNSAGPATKEAKLEAGIASVASSVAVSHGLPPEHFEKLAQITKDWQDNKLSKKAYIQQKQDLVTQMGVPEQKVNNALGALASMKNAPSGYVPGTANPGLPATSPWKPQQPAATSKTINGKEYQLVHGVSAANDWGEAGYTQWHKGLTSGEKEAFIGYSKQGAGPINNFLRKGTLGDENNPFEPQKPSVVHKRIAHLDAAIAKTSVPNDIMVTRGFHHEGLLTAMKSGKDLTGDVFHDNAFVSTSVNASGGFGGGIKMRIHVPKGAKGAYMDGKMKLTKFPGETELLLGRDSNFRIVGYKKPSNDWAPWEVEVEYLGTGPAPTTAYKAEN